MEAVLCRAQVSVSRGPHMGFGATPARWRISRSPRRVRFIAFVDRIRYEPGRGTCAPGAPASPAGADPTIGQAFDIWLCTESGLGQSWPEIRSSTKDVGHLLFPAGLVQTQAA